MGSDLDWYEFKTWESTFAGKVIEVVESHDRSESYEMDRGHVFAIDNGKFAFVEESGCSCYDYSDASISMYDNKDSALGAFYSWRG